MKNLESKIYDVLKEAGVPVKQAKKMAKKTAQKAEFFIWEKKQGEDKNSIPKKKQNWTVLLIKQLMQQLMRFPTPNLENCLIRIWLSFLDLKWGK